MKTSWLQAVAPYTAGESADDTACPSSEIKGTKCFSASGFSSSVPLSSPSFPPCPRASRSQRTPTPEAAGDVTRSNNGIISNTVVRREGQLPEKASVNSPGESAYENGDFSCSPSLFTRRRGVQSRRVIESSSFSDLPAGKNNQRYTRAERFLSSSNKAVFGTRYADLPETKLYWSEEEKVSLKNESTPSSPDTLFAYRGRQSALVPPTLQGEAKLFSHEAIAQDTIPEKQALTTSKFRLTNHRRQLRPLFKPLTLFAILGLGILVFALVRGRKCIFPEAAWLAQHLTSSFHFGELGGILLSLLSKFSGHLPLLPLDVPFFLRIGPLQSGRGFTRKRWKAFPFLWSPSYDTGDSKLSDLPTSEELQKEFSQLAAGRVPAPEALQEHSKEFKKEIIRVAADVYVAVGFGLANCVIIDAPGGLILVDTMESTAAMEAVWRAWAELPAAKKRRGKGLVRPRARNDKQAHLEQLNGALLARPRNSATLCNGARFRSSRWRWCAPIYKRRAIAAPQTRFSEICRTVLCKHRRRTTIFKVSRQLMPLPPVKAIIYTHFHTDHVFGAAAVVQPGTEVHAYWLTYAEMRKVFTLTAGTTYRRSMRQFGVFIEKSDFLNAGIGPALHYSSREEIGTVLPTHIMYGERKVLNLAGVKLVLLHAPGESKDQLVVWLPEKKLLIGADNLYKAMPNIYAIRGTETRNCNDWIASLDMMRSLEPEFLVLGHTRPLTGREYIASTLIAYRDAIQFIHDQTLRYMNKGYYANDIAHMVKLPPHLASHPFLQPFYGTVPWAVKAIFTHYMGWFSGNPEDLAVMSTEEKAETLLSLAGSVQNLLSHALQNLRDGYVQRALEFASAALHVSPASAEAKTLKILALRATAAKQQAATGRNWFLTAALELEGRAELRLSDSQKRQTLSKLSMKQTFELVPPRLIPERAADLECVLEFHFTDVEENACVHYRRGVAYQKWPCERKADVIVNTTREVWLGILNKDRSPALAVATGDLHVSGSLLTLIRALLSVELEVD